MAIFYALVTAKHQGTVRALPWIHEPWVSLPVTADDWKLLRKGLDHLEELLNACGAKEILTPKKIDLSTIHLFCSCPMGEDLTQCAVDSWGQMHGFGNIYINDASILPSTPGVNPQATIMAIARRNAERFIDK